MEKPRVVIPTDRGGASQLQCPLLGLALILSPDGP